MAEVHHRWRRLWNFLLWEVFFILECLIGVAHRGRSIVLHIIIERVIIFQDDLLLRLSRLDHAALGHQRIQRRDDIVLEKLALTHIINE